jgi:hypothetical protein
MSIVFQTKKYILIFSPVFPQKWSLQYIGALLSLKIFFLLLLVSFVTVYNSVSYTLQFGFLARACVVWVCVGFFVDDFFWGGGCYLPTYLDFFSPQPGTTRHNQQTQTSPNDTPKTLKVSDRLRANRGGRVCGSVSVVMRGRFITVSIPSLYITQQFIPQPIHYSAIYPLTHRFICCRTCVLL